MKDEKYKKVIDKIMDHVSLLYPKTEPQTKEETQELEADPHVEQKLSAVRSLLEAFNLLSASRDLKVSNIKRYALWALHQAKMKIKLTNPITREVFIDRSALSDYQQIRDHLKHLDLLPEIHPLLHSEFENRS